MITATELAADPDCIIVDCRFVLGEPAAGHTAYLRGHIPGAHYLDLERDLSRPAGLHGGRHPLPDAGVLAARLAALGIGPNTEVVAYDDSRLAYAARFWWMLRALGYRAPRLLEGGLAAWVAAGGELSTAVPEPRPCAAPPAASFRGSCDIEALRDLQARGATLLDSREPRRYAGLEEPIDPVAGHIPGALNRCWQEVTDAQGRLRPEPELRAHFGELMEAQPLVVYCGSGVTACVNLYALARLGRDDALLYPGSWSDWCSYL
ncbi:sulfurtransferase [Kineobactrum salinum]|uniref:Sulfurtransferase n=1 Tax=Kineobactrum salinum TaxID=2708301 RepID=A0A6C0U2N9_9GAMM|nr:sulfurtransferase [Kineobactrum salinum]QIB66432.1 sulfurtransferase [Kineobactrum salinum]